MNFKPLTVSGKTYTAADQAAAFETYINNDSYLSSHRGQYAERNAVFLPMVNRIDLSIMQDVIFKVAGHKNSGQVRLDITNFGNLLNKNWGVGQRLVNGSILTAPTGRRHRQAVLQPADRQRQPAHVAAADSGGRVGRLRDDAQLPIHVLAIGS